MHWLARGPVLLFCWPGNFSIRLEFAADCMLVFLDGADSCATYLNYASAVHVIAGSFSKRTVCYCLQSLCSQVSCQRHYLPDGRICSRRKSDSRCSEPTCHHNSLRFCHYSTVQGSLAALLEQPCLNDMLPAGARSVETRPFANIGHISRRCLNEIDKW